SHNLLLVRQQQHNHCADRRCENQKTQDINTDNIHNLTFVFSLRPLRLGGILCFYPPAACPSTHDDSAKIIPITNAAIKIRSRYCCIRPVWILRNQRPNTATYSGIPSPTPSINHVLSSFRKSPIQVNIRAIRCSVPSIMPLSMNVLTTTANACDGLT